MAHALTDPQLDQELSLTTSFGELQESSSPVTGRYLILSSSETGADTDVYITGKAGQDGSAASGVTQKATISAAQLPVRVPIDGWGQVALAASSSITVSARILP